jgi:hypothetical protein
MARKPAGSEGGGAPASRVQPYVTETVEVDPDTWAREATADEDAYIGAWTAAAQRMLISRGYDLGRAAPLLFGDTEGDLEAHLAAGIILYAQRMASALQRGEARDMRRHAMHFATFVERASHLEAWWPAVVRHRQRATTDRGNIQAHNARRHEEAAKWWAPWQKEFRALRAAGWTEAAARQETGGRIVETTGKEVDDKTLRKWLGG